MRAVICQGDPTSHGGKVLEGNPAMKINGKLVAYKGHMTFCPKCKGNFPISEGLDFHHYTGKGTAVDGMKTACGAKLIATQQLVFVADRGGGGAESGATEAPKAAKAETSYGASFRAVDQHTGEPVAGLAYRMVLADGTILRGVTDADGKTQCATSQEADTVELYWETEVSDDQRDGEPL